MAKINEFIEKLKDYEGRELTTKFLIEELGITSYYIGVLTHKDFIEKVDRGIYRVKELSKSENHAKVIMNDKNNGDKQPKKGFIKFRDLVLSGSYEEAYDALVECCEANKDNHDYDNHNRMYFILLTAILKLKGSRKKLEFDYDNNLLEFSEVSRTDYYESFLKAREAILSEAYEEAYENIKIYAEKEMRRYNENKISTTICKHLLEQISIMNNNKKKSANMLNEAYKLIRTHRYEEAKKIFIELDPILNTPRAKKLCLYLKELCEEIIKFQNDETLILPDKQNYNFPEDTSISKAFSIFMSNKDYLSANMYIEKCCKLYKSSFYHMANILLEDLLYINKNHCFKNPVKTEIQELRINTVKNDGEARKHYSRFLWALQHLDFDDAYKEIKLNLSYIVNAKTSVYSNSHQIYELLKYLKEMQETKLPLEEVNYTYLSSDSEQFNFNRAMRLQDWRTAYSYLSKIDISKSLSLEANSLILKAIFRQDKINRGIELTEEDELKPLSSHLKKEIKDPEKEQFVNPTENKPSDAQEEKELQTIEVKAKVNPLDNYEDASKFEILDSIKNLSLNYETLYNLVKNREFEEAFALIEREEQKGYSLDSGSKVNNSSVMEEKQPLEEIHDEKTSPKNLEEEPIEKNPKEEIKEEVLPRELSEKQKHKLEVLESIKDIELNYANLYNLVYNNKYEEALYLLEREEKPNEQPSRLNFNARRLLSQYFHIVRGTFQEVEQKPIDYTQDCFKIFFAAINNRDYFLALDYVNECIEHSREPEEMRLFKLILKSICAELTKIEEEKRAKEEAENARREAQIRIENINKKLFNLSNKKEFDDSDIRECHSLLQEKVDISYENGLKFDKDELVLGAAEAALMALNKELNDCYFATMEVSSTLQDVDDEEISYSLGSISTKIGDVFYNALKCGDLLTVEKIITTENWDNFRDKMTNANLRLLKNLLVYMHEHMDLISDRTNERNNLANKKVPQDMIDKADKLAYELLSDDEKKNFKKVELLRKLNSLVKHQKYASALGEILESDVDLNQDKQLLDITADIVAAKEAVKLESHGLFDEFNAALKSKNIEEARKKLVEYSGYITSKSIDRDLSYHRKRIDILEKDMKQADYEEKEKIYSEALAMFYNKRQYNHFQKSIELLDQYIALDNDINSKGYILRARAYEKIKQFKSAKNDYKKALQISPDPVAYQALGTYSYEEGDYDRTIFYLEKFQAIRPFKSEAVSRMLATSYNSTGQKEKSAPFNRHLNHLYYTKKK